jgi:hypothetical protein
MAMRTVEMKLAAIPKKRPGVWPRASSWKPLAIMMRAKGTNKWHRVYGYSIMDDLGGVYLCAKVSASTGMTPSNLPDALAFLRMRAAQMKPDAPVGVLEYSFEAGR